MWPNSLLVSFMHLPNILAALHCRQRKGCDEEHRPHEGPHLTLGLFFELGHTAQPADGGDATQQPGQLRMRRNMGLDEDAAACRVNAASQVHRCRPGSIMQIKWEGGGARERCGLLKIPEHIAIITVILHDNQEQRLEFLIPSRLIPSRPSPARPPSTPPDASPTAYPSRPPVHLMKDLYCQGGDTDLNK